MGTHPIFESDFDCLTEMILQYEDGLVRFNCGKIKHVFDVANNERKEKGAAPSRTVSYTSKFTCDAARRAFETGECFLKIHGECGMLDFDAGKAYRRSEGKDGHIPCGNRELIPGQNVHFGSRTYSLAPVELNSEEIDKIKAKKARRLAAERGKVCQTFIEQNRERFDGMISIEWIGRKFQQTPGVVEQVGIVAHVDMNTKNFPSLVGSIYMISGTLSAFHNCVARC